MGEAGPRCDGPTSADLVFVIDLFNRRTSPEVIQTKLIERGVDSENAAALVRGVIEQAISNDAVELVNGGLSQEEITRQLVAKGYDQQVVSAVVEDLMAQIRFQQLQQPEEPWSSTRVLWKLVGGVVFVIGVGLWFGNLSGAFPTFPNAGFIVMGVGSAIWSFARVS